MGYRFLMTLSTLAVILLLGAVPAVAQGDVAADGWTALRTADGHLDFQGVWDYRTMTPLERPDDLAGKQFFTDEEAAAFEQEAVERRHKDRRTSDGLSAAADVANAYNESWWDYGKKLTKDKRTSLIVDPPDGRVPLTQVA